MDSVNLGCLDEKAARDGGLCRKVACWISGQRIHSQVVRHNFREKQNNGKVLGKHWGRTI